MRAIVLLLSLVLIFTGQMAACVNGETKTLKNGVPLYHDREGAVPYGHNLHIDGHFAEVLKQLDSLYNITNDLDYLSDRGVILIFSGKYDQAIALYRKIEKLEPGRYSTAANLGTAYELAGENEKALKWIEKSILINPSSHHNSEWIHANILRAKINGESYITTKFLLNTDFGTDSIPSSDLSTKALRKLSFALYYQLNERVTFIKDEDPIVAQLLFDLGNIAFLLGRHGNAEEDYKKALSYGLDSELINTRIAVNDRVYNEKTIALEKEIRRENWIRYLMIGSFSLMILYAIYFLVMRLIGRIK